MGYQPTATRQDVVRLVARYVRLEFSIRSASGRIAIDESRVARKRAIEYDPNASFAEGLDAIYNSNLRRAVYARPGDPSPIVYRDGKSFRMRRVAPLRDVAQIVKTKTSRGSSADSDIRNWRGTVAQKLAHIPRAEAAALLSAERIRIKLRELRNVLDQTRRDHKRLRSGGRMTRNLRHHAEGRIAEIHSREALESDRLKSLVRTGDYRHGLDSLLKVCTESPDVETYLFGE